VLFGDDQAFSKANESFEFISLLMERMNEFSMELYGEQYEMRYSTVDEFLSSLKEMDLDYEVY
jgi:fructose 1,6-bisphosphatase